MNRLAFSFAFPIAFILGMLAVLGVALSYLGNNAVAFLMSLGVGAVFGLGALELHRFRRTTQHLQQTFDATTDTPPLLATWLDGLPLALREPVRQRLDGARNPLPTPTLAPYLVGLLVMLGMLGTFIGLMLTLGGAGFALEGGRDLQTMRESLAAPIRGLGLAFGTSLAGVATSAMLGLMATLARRERTLASQQLDRLIAGPLRPHSAAQRRDDTLAALQAVPQLVAQVQTTLATLDANGRRLEQRLHEDQSRFHEEARNSYRALADAVGAQLQQSLRDAAQAANAQLAAATGETLDGIAARANAAQAAGAASVAHALTELMARIDAALAADRRAQDEREAARLMQWTAALDAQGASQRAAWQASAEDNATRQTTLLAALETTAAQIASAAAARDQATLTEIARLTQASLDDIARLVNSALDAPRAAAELVAELRGEIDAAQRAGLARDNAQLAERARLLETLTTLLGSVEHAAGQQRAAIDALVGQAATVLNDVGQRFAADLEARSDALGAATVQVQAGGIELASLGDAFALAVARFGESSATLDATLQRVERGLDEALQRSEAQMGYYVAQAREVIELSLSAQRQVFDELQAVDRRPTSADLSRADALAEVA